MVESRESYGLVVVVTLLCLVRGCAIGAKQVVCGCAQSKHDVAERVARDIAYSAYPDWQSSHPGQHCPSLADLASYRDSEDRVDPWGNDWQLACALDGSLVVHSAGEDGKLGSEDDVWSVDR